MKSNLNLRKITGWTLTVLFVAIALLSYVRGRQKIEFERALQKLNVGIVKSEKPHGRFTAFFWSLLNHDAIPQSVRSMAIEPFLTHFRRPENIDIMTGEGDDLRLLAKLRGRRYKDVTEMRLTHMFREKTESPLSLIGTFEGCETLFVWFRKGQLREENFIQIAEKFPNVRHLSISADSIDWTASNHLQKLPIELLTIECQWIYRGKGVREFEYVGDTTLGSAETKLIATNFPNLRTLVVAIEDSKSLSELSKLKALSDLSLHIGRIDDGFGESFSHFESLKQITLTQEGFDDEDKLDIFFGGNPLDSVTTARIIGYEIHENTTPLLLSKFPNLDHLYIRHGTFDANAFNPFVKKESLSCIELVRVKIHTPHLPEPTELAPQIVFKRPETLLDTLEDGYGEPKILDFLEFDELLADKSPSVSQPPAQ